MEYVEFSRFHQFISATKGYDYNSFHY